MSVSEVGRDRSQDAVKSPQCGKAKTMPVNQSFRSLTPKGRLELFFKMGKIRLICMTKSQKRKPEDRPTPLSQQQQLPSSPLRPSQLSTPIFSTSCPRYRTFVVCCLSSRSLPFLPSLRNAGLYSCSRQSQCFGSHPLPSPQEPCCISYPFSFSVFGFSLWIKSSPLTCIYQLNSLPFVRRESTNQEQEKNTPKKPLLECSQIPKIKTA